MSEKAPTAELAGDAGRSGWERHLDRCLVARLGRRPTVIPSALGDRIWRRVEYFATQAGALTGWLLDRGMPAARDGSDAPIVHVRWREMPESPGARGSDVPPVQTMSSHPARAVVKVEAVKTEAVVGAARHAEAEPVGSAVAGPRQQSLAVASMGGPSARATGKGASDTNALAGRPDDSRGDFPPMAASASRRLPASSDPAEDGSAVELVVPPVRRRTRRGAPVHSVPAVDAGRVSSGVAADIHPGPGALPDAEQMVELRVPGMRRSGSPAVVAGELPQYGRSRLSPAIDGWPSTSVPAPAPVAAATWESPGKARDGIVSIARSEDSLALAAAAASGERAAPTVVPPSANAQENDGTTGPRTRRGAARVLSLRAPADVEIGRQHTVAPVLVDRIAGTRPLHHSPVGVEGAPWPALPHVGHGHPPSSGLDPDASFDASQAGPQRVAARMPSGLPVQDPLQVPALSTGTQVAREDVSPRPAWQAAIDIDRLARQVERRITKRLAVDAERRGGGS